MQKIEKKIGVARSRDRVRDRDRGVNRVRDRNRGVNRVSKWDRVRGGGEHVTLIEKHSPPKKWKNHLVRRKLTS